MVVAVNQHPLPLTLTRSASMNIYDILSTKTHNKHFLNRYYIFIRNKSTQVNTDVYLENHHILPVSIFPEFKNLKQNPWNSILLTEREHKIVHRMLIGVFTESSARYKMLCASLLMNCMSNREKEAYFKSPEFLQSRKNLGIRKKSGLLTNKEKTQYTLLKTTVKDNWSSLNDEDRIAKFKPGLDKMNSLKTCIHCGFTTTAGNIGRYHNDKCKHK